MRLFRNLGVGLRIWLCGVALLRLRPNPRPPWPCEKIAFPWRYRV